MNSVHKGLDPTGKCRRASPQPRRGPAPINGGRSGSHSEFLTGASRWYARSHLFERRRLLMEDWSAYLDGASRREVGNR